MGAYILRRVLLMIPTLFGIMAVAFLVIQFAPGGPVEQAIARLSGDASMAARPAAGGAGDLVAPGGAGVQGPSGTVYRGASGLSPKIIAQIERRFGFDKPPLERFGTMLWNYLRFDFGDSFFRDISVIDLIREKLPVSITLGLWMTL